MFSWLFKQKKPVVYSRDEHGRRLQSSDIPRITETTALNLSSCFAAIRYLSEDIGMMSMPLYKRASDGSRTEVRNHPINKIFNISPDDVLPAMMFREYMLKCLLTNGNFYAEIETTKGGELLYLHKIDPTLLTEIKFLPDGKPRYFFRGLKSKKQYLDADECFHVQSFLSNDGIKGTNFIRNAATMLSIGVQMDKFANNFIARGATTSGVLSFPAQIPAADRELMEKKFDDNQAGPENAGRTIIVDMGGTYTPISLTPQDIMMISQRRWTTEECCRIWRVPPAILMDNERATFSNNEQQFDNYKFALLPWLKRIEQVVQMKLLNETEQESLYVKHKFDSILRADTATRHAAYTLAIANGMMCPDQGCDLEDWDRPPDGSGSVYRTALNIGNAADLLEENKPEQTQPIPQPQEQTEEQPQPQPEPKPNESAVKASMAAVKAELHRMFRREAEALRKAAKSKNFVASVERFYERHAEIFKESVRPTTSAYVILTDPKRDPAAIVNQMAVAGVAQHKEQLLELSGNISAKDQATQLPIAVEQFLQNRSLKEIKRILAT